MSSDEKAASGGDSTGKTFSLHVLCGVILVVIFTMDLQPPDVAVGVLYLVVVLLTLWTPQSTVTLLVAMLSSLLIVAAFFYKPPVDFMWKVLFNCGISLFAVWIPSSKCAFLEIL